MAKQADARRKVWGSSLVRKTPLRAKKSFGAWSRSAPKRTPKAKPEKRARPLRQKGKKGNEWDGVRAKLKPLFAAAGITFCEIRLPGCWHNNALGFAHSKKRRNIVGREIEEVCLGCNPCHDIIEAKPESEMTELVRAIIELRPVVIPSIF